MKKILLSSLVAAAAAVPAFAGVNNLNYQAVIKNGGNVLVDQQVNLKFELLDNADKVVFTEVQSPKTNGAGYVACQLGQENDLSELNWGDLKLRVSIDLGSGYQVFSTEEVSSVPTALYALKSADSDMIIEAVEGLMVDVESNKTSILGINAELVKYDGFIEDVENFNTDLVEKLEPMIGLNYEEINDFHERITQEVIALNEFKDDSEAFNQRVSEELAKIQGLNYDEVMDYQDRNTKDVIALAKDVEELNTNIEAFAEMNEARLDKMQKQMDEADQSFANLGENLDNSFAEMEAKFAEIDGQLENLNNVSAVVRVNEEAIEQLTPEVERLVKESEETQAKLNSFGADIAQIEGLAAELESVKESIDNFNNVSAVVLANQKGVAENKEAIAQNSKLLAQLEAAVRELTAPDGEESINTKLAQVMQMLMEQINEIKEYVGMPVED